MEQEKENILALENVDKHFGDVHALSDVSFNVERGSITGVLGPNGAGKTTLLRLINGIIYLDNGRITLDGEPVSLKTGRQVGYMPEERGLYDKMTVADQIVYFGRLKGGDEARLRLVMADLLDMFGLQGQEKRKIKELSKGNQQKVQIISTIVHEPKLVILDEPFSGFDPINGQTLTQVIERMRNQGATIILSSHNMHAIEEMCSDIALLNHGHLLVKDSITNIKEQHRDNKLLLTTRTPLDLDLLRASRAISSAEPTKTTGWRSGHAYKVEKAEGAANADVLDAVCTQAEITQFEEALPTLNDIFLKLTSQGL